MKISPHKITYATYILITINFLVYGLEINLGGSQSFVTLGLLGELNSQKILTLELLGALVPEKVLAGEWWRLIGANFLHFSLIHLATNMLSLYFIGRLMELSLGFKPYLLIYFASGIGSMLTFSLLSFRLGLENVLLVGASAAIMGLMGAVLAIFLQVWLRKRHSSTAKRRLQQVVLIVIIQFVFDHLIPQVSFHSHLFGFIIGFLVSSPLILAKFNPKKAIGER